MQARNLVGLAIVLSLAGGPALAQSAGGSSFMDAMKKMEKDMPKNHSGNTDVDFAKMMIPHHQAAIDMAKIELQSGKDPILKKMAEKMIKDQEKEVADLKEWLAKNSK